MTGVYFTNKNLAGKKPEPIIREKAGSWGGAGASAVEPLTRRGGGGGGESRRERRVRGPGWRSWGEGVSRGERPAAGS